jgi:SlyX protein
MESRLNEQRLTEPLNERLNERLIEIEAKLSLAEDLLDALNQTVFRQQQQMDRLQQDVRALRQQLQDGAPGEAASPGDEIPPHY